jgi:hypothetical protein
MNSAISVSPSDELSFSNQPDAKVAPIVIGGAMFLGKAIVGGAVSWGTERFLNNRFPPKK